MQHLSLDNIQLLTALYFDRIMVQFKKSVSTWTKYSPEIRLLATAAINAGPFIGHRLDILLFLCSELAKPEIEYELKVR